jgi:putative hydrolase of the HAD superfamily
MSEHPSPGEKNSLIERIRQLSAPLDPQPTGYPASLQPLEGIRAVVFDIYGTLLISASGDIGAGEGSDEDPVFHKAVAAAGLQCSDERLHGTNLLHAAVRSAQAIRRREGIEYPEVDILRVWEEVIRDIADILPIGQVSWQQLRRMAIEYECLTNPVWPMPGASHSLHRLHKLGLKMGIVSNAQFYTPLMFPALLDAELGQFGFDPDLCTWSFETLEAKPSIALFQRTITALEIHHGIPADEILYVGNDMLKDIWPAQVTGCRTALFAGDSRSLRLRGDDERCRDTVPDIVITELSQLLSVCG